MKTGKIDPKVADSITRGCNGIMRSYKLQLDVVNHFGKFEEGQQFLDVEKK